MDISQIPVPCATKSVFDRILTIGWYDGITSGAAFRPEDSSAFRFDLITWGPSQNMRVFALSRIGTTAFDDVVRLWSQLESPQFPVWHMPWRLVQDDLTSWNRKLDAILANAAKPEIAVETDAMFEKVLALKTISEDAPVLPARFEADAFLDNYEEWHRYLGGTS